MSDVLDEDNAAAHIYPSDLTYLEGGERNARVFSIPMCHPDKGKTVPLFSMGQVIYAPPEPYGVGDVVVTTDDQGNAVAVTRQDTEGRVTSVIWERSSTN